MVGVIDRWFPLILFFGIGLVLCVVGGGSVLYFGFPPDDALWRPLPDLVWLDAWVRWDAGYYVQIAEHGYEMLGGADRATRTTHFFPMYPILIRFVSVVTGNVFIAGMLITLVVGAASAVLFERWCRGRMDPGASRFALLVLLLYPFAFFLYATVYSDALFLFTALAAFTLLERDRPVLAGLVGALATATRPVAPAIALGLAVRLLERRGVMARDAEGRRRLDFGKLRPGDAGVLLCTLGIGAFSAYLWVQFNDPFHYATTMGDWKMLQGPETWFKLGVWRELAAPVWTTRQPAIIANMIPPALALLLLPRVWRQFGVGYAVYSATVIAIYLVGNSDFIGGTGRYTIAAFPCFAAAGHLLASHRRVAWPVLIASAVALAVLFSAFARWYPVS